MGLPSRSLAAPRLALHISGVTLGAGGVGKEEESFPQT